MIHSFTEFKKLINEDFIDGLTGEKEEGEAKKKEAGSKEQPDVQDATIEDFYKTLQEFADSKRSIPVETLGNMKYSKTVENIQVALSFLGYPLPKHGVDGYFGPETAAAIAKFNDETAPKKETSLKKTDDDNSD